MKKSTIIAASVFAALVLVVPTWASPKTVTLNVSGMTCSACPITVRKALEKVPGVSKVDVQFERNKFWSPSTTQEPTRMR